jgi:flagellar hook-basal body complex protein FliE
MDLARMISEVGKKDSFNMEERLTVTMTGQNFITFVQTLNNTVKAISERQKSNSEMVTQVEKETTSSKGQKKTDGSA